MDIGLLSPATGGFYFGEVLAGAARAAAAAGARVTLVQTLEAGREPEAFTPEAGTDAPVGWERFAGFLGIAWATSETYLRRLRAQGTPVVVISNHLDIDAASVGVDNVGGVHDVVAHLAGHGHERVAFVGNLHQSDMADRHAAYCAALADLGLGPPRLIPATDHVETGGASAAAGVIDAVRTGGVTAVVAATDRVALGLLRALAERGVSVPGDLAVVGFDDVEAGWSSSPPLATVHQDFTQLGEIAMGLLLAELAGEPVEHRHHAVRAELVPRASCGCADSAVSAFELGARAARSLATAVRAELARPGGPDRLDAVVEAHLARAFPRVPAPEMLSGFARTSVELLGGPDPRGDDLHRALAHVTVALTGRLTSRSLAQLDRISTALVEQYAVGMGLFAGGDDPTELAWLRDVDVRLGYLGLWDGAPGDGRLRIAGVHDPTGALDGDVGTVVPVREFPPRAVLDRIDGDGGAACYVVPVSGPAVDLGFLCLVGGLDTEYGTGRGVYSYWTAQLAVALREQGLLAERRRLEERLRWAALHDTLTGLPNRRLLLERLADAIDRAQRGTGSPFAVVYLDLDGFKQVNDSLGHLAGDALLVNVAHRMRDQLTAGDVLARFGGDEFALLLGGGDAGRADDTVERVCAAVAAPIRLGATLARVTASAGVALWRPGATADDLLREADLAMYTVKAARRTAQGFAAGTRT